MATTGSGLADEIYSELGSPSDTSSNSIFTWLKQNLGQLNNLIGSSFAVDGSDFFNALGTSPSAQEQAILKELYKCHYYVKNVNSNLGAAAYASILEVSSDGAMVRKANKNDIAKSYLALKGLCEENLKILVNAYKINISSGAEPHQVAGDDDLTPVTNPYEYGDTRLVGNP